MEEEFRLTGVATKRERRLMAALAGDSAWPMSQFPP